MPSSPNNDAFFEKALPETHLFVGKHKQHGFPQLIFRQHSAELILCLSNSLPVITVHYKDKAWKWKEEWKQTYILMLCLSMVVNQKYILSFLWDPPPPYDFVW